MPQGGRRPGAGRPKGSKNRPLAERLAERKEKRQPRPVPNLNRTCPVCATQFVRPCARQGLPLKYCSEPCRAIGYERGSERPCPTCGGLFRPTKWGGQGVCSMACRRYPEARIYPTDKERLA